MDQGSHSHVLARRLAGGVVGLALVCGVVEYARARPEKRAASDKEVLYYVDPMHPAYRSDKPGIAPDCGMDLVPVYAKDAGRSAMQSQTAKPVDVAVDAQTRSLYGIGLARVEMASGDAPVRVFGQVAADDTRIYRLNVSTAGFVKDTHDDAVGTHVRKDHRLATIYSSELIYAVSGFLSGNLRIPSTGMRDTAGSPEAQNSQSKIDYLRNLGMSSQQIDELQRTHRVPDDIYVESPVDGLIVSRTASPGLRFEKNAELYSVVDLSHVWVLADVFGSDALAFRPGAEAKVTLQDTGESFRAKVSSVLPEIDPKTRTLKARLEVDNPKLRLRPEMFVTVEVMNPLPAGLTVPADAVIDSGLSKRVFAQTTPGHFEAREVETGWRDGGRVQILKGVKAGEMVVASGTFLIDSESRLEAASLSSGAPSMKTDDQRTTPVRRPGR